MDKNASEQLENVLVTDDAPPAPSDFSVVGATISNIMNWGDPGFQGYAFTEILRSSQDNLATAEVVTTSSGRVAVDQVGEDVGVQYFYWVRHVKNYQGTFIRGPVNGTAGTPAEALGLGDGGIRGVAVEKIFAVQGTIAEALIGRAHINNAMIGNIIQSNNFLAGAAGWQINKNGNAEFRNIIARGDIQASSLKANTAMVNDGNIAQLAVDTLNIKDQAVTFPMVAHTASQLDIGGSGWQPVQTLSIESSGAPAVLMFSAPAMLYPKTEAPPQGGTVTMAIRVMVRLVRNGVEVRRDNWGQTVVDSQMHIMTPVSIAPIFYDEPEAGPCTYQVQVSAQSLSGGSPGNGRVAVSRRTLFLIETKK